MGEIKKKHLMSSDDNYNVEEVESIFGARLPEEEVKEVKVNVKIGVHLPKEKREVLKRDLLSKEDILTVKIITPDSNAASVGIDDELFSIQSFDVSEEVEPTRSGYRLRKSLTNAKYFAVKSYPIDSIAKEKEDGEEFLRINGDIRIKRKGSSEPKELDKIFFTSKETAYSVAALATEVEIEKIEAMEKELSSVRKFLYDQYENGRF